MSSRPVNRERRSITTRAGIELAADRYGASPGLPPIVLLHGGGQTRHSWEAVAQRLADSGHEAWTIDLRGHGESAWAPDGDYSTDAMVEDLRDVCDHLARPPAVVGASMGGLVALMSEGGRYQGRLHALVLVDIATQLEEKGVERIVGFMSAAPDGFASLEDAAVAISAYRGETPRSGSPEGLRKNLRVGADGRWRWHWDPAFLESKSREGRRDRAALRRAAESLRLPTLLVRGRESDMLSEEGARRFLVECPSAEYVDVAGAGHMVVGDRNDVFAAAVVSFLDRVVRDEERAS